MRRAPLGEPVGRVQPPIATALLLGFTHSTSLSTTHNGSHRHFGKARHGAGAWLGVWREPIAAPERARLRPSRRKAAHRESAPPGEEVAARPPGIVQEHLDQVDVIEFEIDLEAASVIPITARVVVHEENDLVDRGRRETQDTGSDVLGDIPTFR